MNATTFSIAIAALAASCASSAPSIDFAKLGDLDFAVPSGWQKHDRSDSRLALVEWTPSDNDGKESLTIIRTSPRAALTKAGVGYVERLLDRAQTNLPKSSFSKPSQLTTQHGFAGVRIEGTFVPAGKTETYQRIHAVFLDGDSLVHVLYTAKNADREAFDIVVNSLSRRGG